MAARFTVGPTPVYSPRRPWVWIISLKAENVLLYLGTSPSKSLPWACILTLTRSVGVAMALPMVPVKETFHHQLVGWYRNTVHIFLGVFFAVNSKNNKAILQSTKKKIKKYVTKFWNVYCNQKCLIFKDNNHRTREILMKIPSLLLKR